jgi:hypothetical protein
VTGRWPGRGPAARRRDYSGAARLITRPTYTVAGSRSHVGETGTQLVSHTVGTRCVPDSRPRPSGYGVSARLSGGDGLLRNATFSHRLPRGQTRKPRQPELAPSGSSSGVLMRPLSGSAVPRVAGRLDTRNCHPRKTSSTPIRGSGAVGVAGPTSVLSNVEVVLPDSVLQSFDLVLRNLKVLPSELRNARNQRGDLGRIPAPYALKICHDTEQPSFPPRVLLRKHRVPLGFPHAYPRRRSDPGDYDDDHQEPDAETWDSHQILRRPQHRRPNHILGRSGQAS